MMRGRTWGRFWVLITVWAAMGLLWSSGAFGQDAPSTVPSAAAEPNVTAPSVAEPNAADPNAAAATAPTGEPPAAGAATTPLPTIDELQRRKQETSDSTTLADDVKARLIEAYDNAIAQLNQDQELTGRGRTYAQGIEAAPNELTRTRETLAQPAAPLPVVEPNLALPQAEQALAQANTALEAARRAASERESESKRRAERRTKIPEEISLARQRLEEIEQRLATLSAQSSPSVVDQANQTLLQLEKSVLQNRIDTNTQELAFYDATRDLLAARRDLAAREQTAAEKLTTFWQDKVAALRSQAAQAAQNEAARARRETRDAHPALKAIVDKNAELAQAHAELLVKVQELATYSESVTAKLSAVRADFEEAQTQIANVGRVTNTMGVFLLGKRAQLPKIAENQRRIRNRDARISQAAADYLMYDQQWSQLGDDFSDELAAVEAQLDDSVTPAQRQTILAEATNYLESQRKSLRTLADLSSKFAESLSELDPKDRQLVKTVREFSDFIDANILWVKSSHIPSAKDVGRMARAVGWVLSPTNWQRIGTALWTDFKSSPPPYLLIVMVLIAAFLFHKKLHRRVEAVSEKVRQVQTDRFAFTLEALAGTVLLAATWPVLLLLLRWRLLALPSDDFSQALAAGFGMLSAVVFVFSFLHHLAMAHGLAQDHFRMRSETLVFLRRHLRWFFLLAVPLAFVSQLMRAQQVEEMWDGTVGRLTFILSMIALSAFLLLILRPKAPLVDAYLKQRRGGWLERLRFFWYTACLLGPLALAVLAGMGYLYGARHLSEKFFSTLGLIAVVLLLRAMFARGLMVAQRRLAVLERQKRQAAAEAAQAPAAGTPEKDPSAAKAKTDKPEQTIFEMSQQTRRLIGAISTIILAAGFWYIWDDVLPALAKIGAVGLYGPEEQAITLGAAITAVIVFILTIVVARNVPGLLEILVLRRLPIDRGVRFAIITICRYLLVIIGVSWAFTEIGIGWGKIQWLVAAMTVGLGFGLQEIFANFISGLIMLFEQPVRVDDVVTVGDVTGTVTMIRIRATTIRKWDQRELIVPNKEFITGQLINWTLSDNTLRRNFPVGIAYGSDIRLAEKLLYEIAEANPRVLKDPPPMVLFAEFGDNSLNFELRVFFSGIENSVPLWHEINVAIDDAFRQHKIEIAFPQRDIHIRTIDREIPIIHRPEGPGQPTVS